MYDCAKQHSKNEICNQTGGKPMSTLLKRLWNIVTTVLVAAVVLLAVLLVGVRLGRLL